VFESARQFAPCVSACRYNATQPQAVEAAVGKVVNTKTVIARSEATNQSSSAAARKKWIASLRSQRRYERIQAAALSSLSLRATICKASSGSGRCSAFASSHGAVREADRAEAAAWSARMDS
jgi:hypothetical protein